MNVAQLLRRPCFRRPEVPDWTLVFINACASCMPAASRVWRQAPALANSWHGHFQVALLSSETRNWSMRYTRISDALGALTNGFKGFLAGSEYERTPGGPYL
jgi:hypothetical protein